MRGTGRILKTVTHPKSGKAYKVLVDKKMALGRATGPGSMGCEGEIQRLCVAGQWNAAYDLAKRHWSMLNEKMRERVKKWRPSDVKELASRQGVLL